MSKLIMINPKLAYHHRLFLLEDLPKNSICAEIGVCHGTFSEKILEICNPNILHLIDPYLGDIFNHNKQYLEGNFKVHKEKYEETNFEDGYFDWVYIDSEHTFKVTFEHLRLSYINVKKNGFITGDDYCKRWNGVIRAVDIFLRIYKDKVNLEYIKNNQFKIKKIR